MSVSRRKRLAVKRSGLSKGLDAMMNDTVRVYLTMIKRLMNYKESKTPGGIPSGCVLKRK